MAGKECYLKGREDYKNMIVVPPQHYSFTEKQQWDQGWRHEHLEIPDPDEVALRLSGL